MKIRDFMVRGYKSLRSLSMSDIGNIAVLVGTNNSGKSNILEALHLFFSEFNLSGKKTEITENHFYRLSQTKPIRFLLRLELDDDDLLTLFGEQLSRHIRGYLQDYNRSVHISTSLTKDGQWSSTEICFGKAKFYKNRATVKQLEFLRAISLRLRLGDVFEPRIPDPDFDNPSVDEGIEYLVTLIEEGKGSIPRKYVVDNAARVVYGLNEDILPFVDHLEPRKLMLTRRQWLAREKLSYSNRILSLSTLKIPTMTSIMVSFQEWFDRCVDQIPPLVRHPVSYKRSSGVEHNLESELWRLSQDPLDTEQDRWNEFNETLASVFDMRLAPVGGRIYVKERRRRYPFYYLGGGCLSWLVLVWYTFQQEGRVLFIEEVESHLHPRLLKSIFNYVREKSGETQVVMTTHSTAFLDQCDYDDVWLVRRMDGQTTARRVKGIENLKEIGAILGVSLSDVLMSRNILFVEGHCDKIVVAALARLQGLRFHPPRVSIIPTRGISKARTHLSVWIEAAGATDAVKFVLLDGDKHAKKKAKELVGRGLIEQDRIRNLKRRDIEDYYPAGLVVEALKEEYRLTADETKEVHQAVNSSKRVHAIQKTLWDLREVPSGTWKRTLAEYIAGTMREEDIEDELRDIIYEIDSVFEN